MTMCAPRMQMLCVKAKRSRCLVSEFNLASCTSIKPDNDVFVIKAEIYSIVFLRICSSQPSTESIREYLDAQYSFGL